MKKPSEKPFHLAGGIEFAKKHLRQLRNGAASIFSGG
jgi:hypothetical protein